jgi:1,2-dihydroxy-3-keto-5-methylthiopentene dioxygenase
MSRLTVYHDDSPDSPILKTEDAATIAAELGTIGVRFERWESPVTLSPDDDAAPLRAKFINEHSHTEDEVRFFVHGAGNFILHLNGRIYDAHCTAGDLISVPANIKHWFDAGERPFFTALRIFTDTSGWVPHFTGDDISARFPAA